MVKKNSFIIIYLIVLFVFAVKNFANAGSSNSENKEEYEIFTQIITAKNYSSKVRPADTVGISISLSLKQIVSIDEKNQIMTSSSILQLWWEDSRLTWDPSNYSNVSEILVPISTLWVPDFFVINTADTNGFIPIQSQSLALVDNDGWVYMVFSLTNLKTRCSINIKTFPFDTQSCSVS